MVGAFRMDHGVSMQALPLFLFFWKWWGSCTSGHIPHILEPWFCNMQGAAKSQSCSPLFKLILCELEDDWNINWRRKGKAVALNDSCIAGGWSLWPLWSFPTLWVFEYILASFPRVEAHVLNAWRGLMINLKGGCPTTTSWKRCDLGAFKWWETAFWGRQIWKRAEGGLHKHLKVLAEIWHRSDGLWCLRMRHLYC